MIDLKARLKRNPIAQAANARLKAWLVERDAEVTLARYASRAARLRLSVPQGVELVTAVRARIGERATNLRWPKAAGDLHVFLCYPLCNWEAVLASTLASFGQVSSFEWRSKGFDDSAGDWLSTRDSMNRAMLAAFKEAERKRPVDIVIGYLSGYTADPTTLKQMAASGAVITNFCFDDKIHWPGAVRGGRFTSTAAIAHAVDLNLTNDPNAAVRYAAHGGLALFHPEAADPDWYKPLDIPFEYDVSFVGARYGWRPRLIRQLQDAGIDVACFGRGWPNGPIANESMNVIYAKSRINLGCGGIGYSKKLLCLKGRDFEVPMSGAVYLTQHNPELSEVFDIGNEILTFDSVSNCAEIIAGILKNPKRAAELRRRARARCLQDHTYTARWATVLRMLGALESA